MSGVMWVKLTAEERLPGVKVMLNFREFNKACDAAADGPGPCDVAGIGPVGIEELVRKNAARHTAA